MIRHSTLKLAALCMLAVVTAGSLASAQTPEWKDDKLNDMLQRKFSAPGDGLAAPSRPKSPTTRGFQEIAPAQQQQKYHQLRKEGLSGGSPRPLFRGEVASTNVRTALRTRGLRDLPCWPRSATEKPVDQVPVAKPNSYVIQLKPDTTGPQLDALLAKYRLRVVSDELIKLGSIVVEQSIASADTNRARSYSKIEDILEPRIIRDLRREPVVKEAIVNTVVGPKWVPKPVAD